MGGDEHICVIGCGVLAIDIRRVAEKLGVKITSRYLEGALHEKPLELRRKLQIAIDEASETEKYSRIVVGYGICGNGTVGIQARDVPLVIPKVQDCIALFLGSDRAYKQEFARFPGTYYISAGWFEEKVQPLSQENCKLDTLNRKVDYEQLAEKYGKENAGAIVDFLTSWQRNYQRAVFIDTGADQKKKYAQYAQLMAREFGWKYESIEGDISLLEKMLTMRNTSDEILIVPPDNATEYDAVTGQLRAVPVWQEIKSADSKVEKVTLSPVGDASFERKKETIRWGLGIDAGGTYTDVVLYDFAGESVSGKSKALTTRWDFTEGIREALEGLDAKLLSKVELVALSTTLATNAIVEGQGQEVGLLVMPPYGLFDPADVPHEPKAVLSGRLEIDGMEISPVVEAEVRRVAGEMVANKGVKAFAVSGFAGTVNPEHESLVKKILREETGLSVTCGHELSELLNFRTRAQTAVLNARIIPQLEKLIEELERVLKERGIDVPVVVVKGDGSLMSAAVARERPVETILSGPAASVAGSRFLTERKNAVVVDMGGTTTDTATIKDGEVGVCGEGTVVGKYKTHVKALDMRTTGLGGDSRIVWEEQKFTIGPRRVAPIAWLGQREKRTREALDYLSCRLDHYKISTCPMEILMLTGHTNSISFSKDELDILKLLEKRPYSLDELAERTGVGYWNVLRLNRLEEHGVIQRCSLTPTDLLHVKGEFSRWDRKTSEQLCEIVAEICQIPVEDLADFLLEDVVRKLAVEVLKKQIDEETDPEAIDDCGVCQVILENLLKGGGRDYRVQIQMHKPIIGIGAPAYAFLPRVGRHLGAEVIVPQNADVANAVGAITSQIVVSRQVRIRPGEAGGYVIEGLTGQETFSRMEEAHTHVMAELEKKMQVAGTALGTSAMSVDMEWEDHDAPTADGYRIFLGRVVNARLVGKPDMVVK